MRTRREVSMLREADSSIGRSLAVAWLARGMRYLRLLAEAEGHHKWGACLTGFELASKAEVLELERQLVWIRTNFVVGRRGGEFIGPLEPFAAFSDVWAQIVNRGFGREWVAVEPNSASEALLDMAFMLGCLEEECVQQILEMQSVADQDDVSAKDVQK